MLPTTPKTILGTTEIIKQADMPSKTYRIQLTGTEIPVLGEVLNGTA